MRRTEPGTEIDEVRGGLRAPIGVACQAEAAGSGFLRATATRRREPTVSRPPPGPPLGAARAGGRGGANLELFNPPSRPSPREAGTLQLAALQAHGRRRAAPRRGAHRRKRPRRALPGMMRPGRLEPRVGPRSMVGPDRSSWPTSDIYSAFFVAEEGTMSSFGCPRSGPIAYADRASHYCAQAGGKVDKDTPPRPRPSAS